MVFTASLLRRTAIVAFFLTLLAILSIAPGALSAQGTESEEPTEETVWSADMLVVEYSSVSIGAASADLFSNIEGSAGLQIKSLWSYIPGRDLRLAFTDGVPGAADYTLQVGDLTLEFPENSSGNSSFKWTDVDVDWEDGQTISVRIGQTSALEEPAANTPATGEPTISGTAQVDQTLTADTSAIADEDGLDDVSYSYQWIRSDNGADTDISGETDSTYTLVYADQGKTIKVKVSFTDDADNDGTLTSVPTVVVAAAPNREATGLPTIGGTPRVRDTLTADTANISDPDGLTNVSYTYQWTAGGSDIDGATSSTYTLTASQQGQTIQVKVSFTDDRNNAETQTSVATGDVAATVPTQPLSATVARGDQIQELDASWQDPSSNGGSTVTGYKVQWKESADSWETEADVSEETVTGTTYTITGLTDGVEYAVRVLATNDVGDSPASTEASGTPGGATDDHGDTPETATPLLTQSWQVRGEIGTDTDVDYFRIDISPEHVGRIRILLVESTHPWTDIQHARGALFDSDGACATRDCDLGGGVFTHINAYLEAGTYYYRVQGTDHVFDTVAQPDERYYHVSWELVNAYRRWVSACRESTDDAVGDALYGCQASLKNAQHPGEDINVEPAWEAGAYGDGVTVVVADTGIDDLHPDLVGTVDLEKSKSTLFSGALYHPTLEHGTNIAGVIAAQHNSTGMRGIAPDVTLLNFRFTHQHRLNVFTTYELYQALTLAKKEVGVSNNSWGVGWTGMPIPMTNGLASGISEGIKDGFHGKGTAYIFGASADGNSNFSGIETYYAVTTVCGVNETGQAISRSMGYGGYGSSLWVCAPWENVATRHHNYYGKVRGTSFSTAVVSGVVALVRGENRNLTWRDVKLLLADTARQNDPSHAEWTTGAYKYGADAERYHYNENYGFGVVDAGAAVASAKTWKLLPAMKTVSAESGNLDMTVTDMVDGAEPTTTSSTLPVDSSINFIEFVEVNIAFDHPSFRDLRVEIISPSGTVSMLAEQDEVQYRDMAFTGKHRFGSAKHLGEDPDGDWTLRVTDHVSGQTGTVTKWDLKVYGHTGNRPSTLPTISGTPQVGETLTADASAITNRNDITNTTLAYQWLHGTAGGDTEITGATLSTYEITDDDLGHSIKVRVTFTDDEDNQETLTSQATAAVTVKPNTPAAGTPTISGMAHVGNTLTVDPSVITDADGITNATFSYQWLRGTADGDTEITGATLSTYEITDDDLSHSIKVRVTFTDDEDNQETLISQATAAVTVKPNTPAAGTPTISGTAHVGNTLTVDPSVITDADGITNATFAYQWIRGDIGYFLIDNAVDSSYTLTNDDEDTSIMVRVSFTDDRGAKEEVFSYPTTIVQAQTNNAATGLPTISGTPQVEQTLTANTSNIADSDGLTNPTFEYQWMANDTDIDDATDSSYKPTVSDVGKAIKVKVSFTDDADNQETLTSVATVEVAATKPGVPGHLNVSPQDTGALDVYWEAPASDGGSDVTGYRVQWKKITGSWDTAADVAEATVTGTTHTITGLSDGVEYRVRVMAMNDVGEGLPSAERSGIPRETRAPEKVIPRVNGATLRVQYDEALDEGSVPAANAFDVRITCQCDSKRWWHEEARRGVDGVTVDGDTVVLTLAIPADAGDGVVVSYTPPSDAAAARTRDLAGNAAAGFVPTEVFNDTEEDAGAEETGEGETALTVNLENVPESHHGTGVFTFEIRFSEEVKLSYKTLRDHAFTVTGGSVVKAQRTDKPSNIPWRIAVRPESNGEVTIILPATTKCAALRAICTADGKKLSGPPGPTDPLTFTVSGPGG